MIFSFGEAFVMGWLSSGLMCIFLLWYLTRNHRLVNKNDTEEIK